MSRRAGLFPFFAALGFLFLSHPAKGDVRPHPIFGDNAVLQQGRKVPVWGTAEDGEEVTVEIAGKRAGTRAREGRWRVDLPPLEAGGPHTLTIRGRNTVEIRNVLVGEVWLASGQSNMQWPMTRSAGGEEAIAQAKHPRIRLLDVPRRPAFDPQESAELQWRECTPEAVRSFSAVAYYFARSLHETRKVPVGIVLAAWGGTRAEAWIPRDVLRAQEEFRAEVEAFERAYKEAQSGKGGGGARRVLHQNSPGALYAGMIRPLVPYAIRGVIWYQGESNRRNFRHYDRLMRLLITSWRRDFGRDLPFIYTALAPWAPGGYAWPALWEEQAKTLELPLTAMAMIYDARPAETDKKNIHPPDKKTVGERLALAARALAYGEAIEYMGPLYAGHKIEGSKVRIRFRHTGSGLTVRGERLEGFIVAGPDGLFVPAQAEIDGDEVVVWSPEISEPRAVRYSWDPWPRGNLFNKEGLPAHAFRTDRDGPIEVKWKEGALPR